jgi:hypothetical protein
MPRLKWSMYVSRDDGFYGDEPDCRDCLGAGYDEDDLPCPTCGGAGYF